MVMISPNVRLEEVGRFDAYKSTQINPIMMAAILHNATQAIKMVMFFAVILFRGILIIITISLAPIANKHNVEEMLAYFRKGLYFISE
jgi:hypothetical protein